MTKFTNYLRSIFTVKNVMLSMAMVLFVTEPSFAQDFSGVETFLDAVVQAITGPLGISIATIAVMAVGFMFMTGRMDWTFAVAIILGIAIVFGAATFAGNIAVA